MDVETRLLVKDVAEEAAQQAVDRTLTGLGVDTTHPLEFQKDMAHLRKWRKTVDAIEGKGVLMALSFAIIGGCTLIWIGMTKFGIK